MITDKIYREQWLKLEGALGYEIYKGSIPVWKKELDDNGYSEERLIKGIDRIIYRLSDGSLKPRDVSLGTLLGACRAAYIEPQLQLQPSKMLSEVTNPKQKGLSPYAQGCCEIIQLLTDKQITPAIFRQKHHELNQKHKIYDVIM